MMCADGHAVVRQLPVLHPVYTAANKTRLADTCTLAYTIIIIIIYILYLRAVRIPRAYLMHMLAGHLQLLTASSPLPYPVHRYCTECVCICIYVYKIFYFILWKRVMRGFPEGENLRRAYNQKTNTTARIYII